MSLADEWDAIPVKTQAAPSSKPISPVDEWESLPSSPKVDANQIAQPPLQQNWAYLPAEATNKMLAGTADTILNAPYNILNLGKAALGTVAAAAGHPEYAPDVKEAPSFVTHLATKYGLIKNAEETPAQKIVDAAIQGGTGMLIGGTPSGIRQAAANVTAGGLAGATGNITEQATGSSALGSLAAIATPYAAANLANKAKAIEQSAVDLQKANVARNAREAGFTIPPSQTNPSMINKVLEGFSGKIQTAQHASMQDQALIRELVAKDVGLNSSDLTPANLQKIRRDAGQSYEALKEQSPYIADRKFKEDINSFGAENKILQSNFPDLANPKINDVLQNISKNEYFDAPSAVIAIKQYRQKATDLYQGINKSGGLPGDRELAETYKGIANSLENLIDRNLTNRGQSDLVNNFRESRETIAKVHTIEDAMNPGSFELDPQHFAKEYLKGAPLSGGLKEIGEFASTYPKATQNLKGQSVLSYSPLDFASGIIGAGAGGAAGGPIAAALGAGAALARPAVRSLILSAPYQKTMGVKGNNTISQMAADFIKKSDANKVAAMQGVFAAKKLNEQ